MKTNVEGERILGLGGHGWPGRSPAITENELCSVSLLRGVMKRAVTVRTLLIVSALIATRWLGSAHADEAPGLRKCRSIAEAQARLACYDAIPLETESSPAPGAKAVPATAEPPALSERRAPNAQMTPEQFGSERLPAPTVAPGGPPVQTLDTITATIE